MKLFSKEKKAGSIPGVASCVSERSASTQPTDYLYNFTAYEARLYECQRRKENA